MRFLYWMELKRYGLKDNNMQRIIEQLANAFLAAKRCGLPEFEAKTRVVLPRKADTIRVSKN